MWKTMTWLGRRFRRDWGVWVTLILLALAGVFISGAGTKRSILNLEDMQMMNIAMGTAFETLEEFRRWFDLWQFRVLVGVGGYDILFPIAVSLFPQPGSPEVRVPVACGLRRSQVFFGAMARFAVQIMLLSMLYLLLGAWLSGIHWSEDATLGYYLRCIVIHIWREIGCGGLALCLVLCFRKRTHGVIFGFVALFLLYELAFAMDFLPEFLLAGNRSQTSVWMWQLHPEVPMGELIGLILFPFVSFALACIPGLLRFRGDLQ